MGDENIFRKYSHIVLTACLIVSSAISAQAEDISISAAVDKTELTLEDSVTLAVTIRGVKNPPPIQLPPLPGFNVLTMGSSSSIQIINGVMASSVRHSYRLTPDKTGRMVIGPISIELDGKTYSSNPITLNIGKVAAKKPDGEAPAFVEAVVSNAKPYVNEEVVLTIRLYRKVDARNVSLNVDLKDFRQEELGKTRRYNRVINGIEYRVHDLATALFPLRPGKTEIPSATVELDLVYRERGRTAPGPFDIFNDGPFANSRIKMQHKILRSRKITLDVQPLPDKNKPADFSNLVGQFNFSAYTSKTELEAGDTTTLTIKIIGQGNIKDVVFNLPDLSDQFKVYPDKPEFKQWAQNNRTSGQKIYKFALIPLAEGIKQLPAFSLSYFDPEKKDYVRVSSKPVSLTVLPSKSGEQFKVVEPETQAKTPAVKVLGKDIFPIHTRLKDFNPVGLTASRIAGYIAALLAPVLIFACMAFFARRREQLKNNTAFFRRRKAFKQAKRQLDALHSSADRDQKYFAGELSRILREYIGNKLNLQGTAFTSAEVESKLQGQVFRKEQIIATRKLLEKYEAMQFSPNSEGSRDKLLDESRDILSQLEKQA